jgi:hypothetical protein
MLIIQYISSDIRTRFTHSTKLVSSVTSTTVMGRVCLKVGLTFPPAALAYGAQRSSSWVTVGQCFHNVKEFLFIPKCQGWQDVVDEPVREQEVQHAIQSDYWRGLVSPP